jgi:nucleoid-associated protein YgaU
VLLLTGCGYVHLGRLPAPAVTVVGDDKLLNDNSQLRLEKKMLQQELALSRAQGDALRMTIENRAADGDTSRRLVEKLNQTTQELAALRASYARLQTERTQAVAASGEAAGLKTQLGATEEKLAEAMRNYTELQGEITRLRTDVAQTRAENTALTEQLKLTAAQNEQAKAALAQLNTDLLEQKNARLRAEQDAATLRTQVGAEGGPPTLAHLRTGSAAGAQSIGSPPNEDSALPQQLALLRTKVDALETERAQLKQQLAAAESAAHPPAELANVQARLAGALAENAALKSTATELSAAKVDLETQLAKLKSGTAPAAEIQTVRDQLHEAQARATALTAENAQLKSRLASASAPSNVITATPPPSGVNATLVTSVPAPGPTLVAPSVHIDVGSSARFHVVTGGDTLAKISTRYYGTPSRWTEILAANRDVLGENNNLVVGRTLRIP